MGSNPQLIDIIKAHFVRKSSAQLQEIAQSNDAERWSPEAMTAATEILMERRAGRAVEPPEPEPEHVPLDQPTVPWSLGLLIGFWPVLALNGFHLGSRSSERGPNDPDAPVAFGPRMSWLAVETTDTQAVAEALELREPRSATWARGIEAAHRGPVFLTPPLGDWTLAVGLSLLPPEGAAAFVQTLLKRLSSRFGDAQYFCTFQNIGLHIWARARRGRLLRGYGWLKESQLPIWNEGPRTKEEHNLGLPPAAGPDENSVMQLACLWSVDPSELDEQFMEPENGILGTLPNWARKE